MSRTTVDKAQTRIGNLDRWKAMHGLRSSSAATPHTIRKRKGTRGANKRRAIREAY